MKDGESGASEAKLALEQLVERLPSAASIGNPRARIEAVGKLHDAGSVQFSTLLACYLDDAATSYITREDFWRALAGYQTRLTQTVCTAAGAALSASSAVRALSSIRALAKLHLVHYSRMPRKLWYVAYKIHSSAEKHGFAKTSVHAPSGHQGMTTVEQELLRMLMLQVSAPEMMTPQQIEAADRAVERLGAEFTLRQPGVADNPFCYDPASEFPPRRAKEGEDLPESTRYFGPGMGYDSLEHMVRQIATETPEKFNLFGKDLPPLAQSNAAHHLLVYWRADYHYAPPIHTPADGSLLVSHGYGQVWQHLSGSGDSAQELSLIADSALMASPPEVWALRGEGGDELATEVPLASRGWVKCGELVGVTIGGDQHWAALIRRMHAHDEDGLQAVITVLSREPRACQLREVLESSEDSGFTDAASRQFGLSAVNAIIIADGSDPGTPPNLLLSADNWKAGRLFELEEDGNARYLRCNAAIRRGADFVRAVFEWVSAPT
jgi:hypothetical protein